MAKEVKILVYTSDWHVLNIKKPNNYLKIILRIINIFPPKEVSLYFSIKYYQQIKKINTRDRVHFLWKYS